MPATLAEALKFADLGQPDKALKRAYECLEANSGDPETWRLLARLHHSAQRWEEALQCAGEAVRCAPRRPELALEHGLYLASSGRRREALAVAEQLEGVELPTPRLNAALGTLLTYCDEPRRALRWFEASVRRNPRNPELLFNLASVQRMLGDLSGAEQTLNGVILNDPDNGRAHLMRSGLRVQTETHNHVSGLRAALNRSTLHQEHRVALEFALGKELEDLDDHDEAFAAYQRGCRTHRQRMRYDVSQDIAVIDSIISTHSRAVIRGDSGFKTEEPIFVVGLPRSGTTLVAQILAGHSSVTSIGETPAFAVEVIAAVQQRAGKRVAKDELVTESLAIDPCALGESYLAATRPQSGQTARFVDKTPLNYLYLGLIARALPAAKVVVVARDPMDTCFSMFKTLFTGAYPFSYDLNELGRYYGAWHRLITHWREVLGDRLLVLQYEDLIADQEGITGRLLDYCGLAWQNSCLRFHEHGNSVATESAAQVRRPLYSSSVGASKHYGRLLDPLRTELGQYALPNARLTVVK